MYHYRPEEGLIKKNIHFEEQIKHAEKSHESLKENIKFEKMVNVFLVGGAALMITASLLFCLI